MRRNVKNGLILLLGCVMILFSGCTKATPKTPAGDRQYPVYYCVVNRNATAMNRVEYSFQSASPEARIAELLQHLTENKSESGQYAVVPSSIRIEYWSLSEDGNLNISFNGEYSSLSAAREAVLRAGVVLTMTQLDNVRSVSFTVNGEPLMRRQEEVGPMTSTMFANNIGEPTEVLNVKLCFVSGAKNGIVITERLVFPDDYRPFEQYLLEYIIAGPTDKESPSGGKPEDTPISGVPAKTKILHVITKNSTCYVDLSKEFLDSDKTIPALIVLHSVADTLIRNLDYIDGVVFSVEGKLLTTYRDAEVPSVFGPADLLQPKE